MIRINTFFTQQLVVCCSYNSAEGKKFNDWLKENCAGCYQVLYNNNPEYYGLYFENPSDIEIVKFNLAMCDWVNII